MKKVLILNGGLPEIPLIQEAKSLGYYVVTTGNRPDLIGHPYADEYIPGDYSDCEAMLRLVRENGIEGVVSCANDFGAITAAYVAEKMGWPGHDSYENALLLHQKDRFKQLFEEVGIRSPKSIPFTSEEAAIDYIKTAEYPIIVKAVDLTGGKGINKAENQSEAERAVRIAFKASRIKHIVIEPFIVGHQESMVGFLIGKKAVCLMSCNCYSPINPYLIQTEIMPSDHDALVREELRGVMEMLAQKLNLADGIITLQYIVKDGKPYVIELMRRCLGNQFLTPVTAVSGFPWHEALVRAELGLDLSGLAFTEPTAKNAGHHAIMARQNGVIKQITIPVDIMKHVFKHVELMHSGDIVQDYLKDRLGYIYYSYDRREDILTAAKQFNDNILLEIEQAAGEREA